MLLLADAGRVASVVGNIAQGPDAIREFAIKFELKSSALTFKSPSCVRYRTAPSPMVYLVRVAEILGPVSIIGTNNTGMVCVMGVWQEASTYNASQAGKE